jgi:hypothetical protein
MIIIKSEKEIKQRLDEPSYKSIIDLMYEDCPVFAKKVNAKHMEWIARVVVGSGSNHKGSKIPFGFLLRFQFRIITFGYDVGISEIKMAESHDEFLDLMNEVRKNPKVYNVEYHKK